MPKSGSGHGSTVSSVDIVQFSCPLYFVEEKEDVCSIEVMRLGNLQGEVSVRFATEDVSAIAGERYQATSGKVTFLDGEARRVVQIAIVQKADWCPTLEFKVRLSDPENCYLGLYLQACNVKVIDDDIFPSDRFREDITASAEGVRNVNSYLLFMEYVKMNFKQKGMRWKTTTTLIFDQMKNANMYLRLSISAYLVNVVFDQDDPTTQPRLLVADNRAATASIIGVLYFAPMFFLHMWDYLKILMDVEGHTRVFLSSCLFRKYLNYSEESRQDVAAAEMQLGLIAECTDLAAGYTAILDMGQMFGKLILVIIFVCLKEPSALCLVLAMPTLISIFAYFRGSAIAEGRRERDRRERELIGIISQTCEKYLTIRYYSRRSAREEMYRHKADQSRQAELPVTVVQNNNLYASKWMGPVFTGFYVCMAAPLVLKGDLRLGFFLATISILEDMSSLFLDVYERFQKITEISEPLMTLTQYYNMPTDLRTFKRAGEHELNWMHAARNEVMKRPAPPADAKMMRTDLIPIIFEDTCYSYGENAVLLNVSLSIRQGTMVAITGDHGGGKATLLKLLGRLMVPDKGNIFIPPHLRILFVSQEPSIVLDLTLWENLTMGCPDGIDPGLVTSILQEMELDSTLTALEYFRDGLGTETTNSLPGESSSRDLLLGDSEGKGGGKLGQKEQEQADAKKRKELAQWFDKLNYTEKAKLHLARGLIMNPELMIMHRPLYHFDDAMGKKLMKLIKQHHNNRGLCMPTTTMHRRRPRTVFMTVDNEWEENVADVIWRLNDKMSKIFEEKPPPATPEESNGNQRGAKQAFVDQPVYGADRGTAQAEQDKSWGDWCFTPRSNVPGGSQGNIPTTSRTLS